MTQLFSHHKKMAGLRRLPLKQSIYFTRTIARSFFTDIVPVDDHISGLNDTQQQVRCHDFLIIILSRVYYIIL